MAFAAAAVRSGSDGCMNIVVPKRTKEKKVESFTDFLNLELLIVFPFQAIFCSNGNICMNEKSLMATFPRPQAE